MIFGAAVRPDGSASPSLARRVGYAAAVAEADPSVDLLCSGGVGRHGPSEAAVMAELLAGSVAAARIILDEGSKDTLQSVVAAAAIVRTEGYGTCLTCTDRYHQLRVRMLFALFGIRSQPVRLVARGARRLQLRMWLREGAAIPYDLVAGVAAIVRRRRP